ncbi:D-alanyl-D-alanine carboxypeptidase [Phycicoccus endophyticus]|nr:D-alanyl-D-alanine carboxypeptidase [Phycicoccus endophyticus]
MVAGATALALLGVGGYATADVLDLAPGVLTLEPEPGAAAGAASGAEDGGAELPDLLPTPESTGDLLGPGAAEASRPRARAVAAAVAAATSDPEAADIGVVVGDGETGTEIWARGGDTPRVPASTVKLLSALAVADTLDLDDRMATSVVARRGSRDLVLLARGDTLLSPRGGDPDAVIGHAGLGDLAEQVADRLRASGRTSVTLRLDLSWAPGPRYPSTWNAADVGQFYARPVLMTGLGTQLGDEGRTAVPAHPEQEVASAFAARLEERGVRVRLQPESTWSEPAPTRARTLGAVESATYAEVLDHTLDVSDNTLIENLVRQAAATAGEPTAPERANAAFIRDRLEAHAVPTAGLVLTDACGLSPGQRAAPRTLAAVLALAVTDEVAPLRRLVAALPVSGLDGTLADRFTDEATGDVAGVPRAKTGTLRTGSGLAGTTVDADGRLLTFVVLADGYPQDGPGIIRAREALDRIVAALTRCGCGAARSAA